METIKTIKIELDRHVNFERAANAPRYFKAGPGEYAEGDQFLGVANPDLRKLSKQFWAEISADELGQLLLDPIHEVRLLAVFMLVEKFNKTIPAAAKEQWVTLYLKCIAGINNWDLVDSSAHLILGRWLEDKPRDLLYEFATTDQLWKQRIAMIATMWYIRNNDFTDALNIAEILMHHEHDLIHKAVGWMLREVGNRDFKTEEAFLKQYYRQLPRTALRYAIEKFPEELRKAYLHGDI
jgi:3-methyladenine DNA glycosylase AlkD